MREAGRSTRERPELGFQTVGFSCGVGVAGSGGTSALAQGCGRRGARGRRGLGEQHGHARSPGSTGQFPEPAGLSGTHVLGLKNCWRSTKWTEGQREGLRTVGYSAGSTSEVHAGTTSLGRNAFSCSTEMQVPGGWLTTAPKGLLTERGADFNNTSK